MSRQKGDQTMDIILWADLQCPYCYAGETNLRHALQELNLEDQVNLIWKSYEIHDPQDGDGDLSMLEIMEHKHGLSRQQAQEQIDSVNKMLHDESNIEIDFGKVHESNDFDAHRLFKMAEGQGCGQKMRGILHRMYFHDHRILHDRKTLLDAAKEAGMDADLTAKMLECGLYAREVREDEKVLDALKAQSVPYFIIDGETADEHLTKDGYMEILKRHLK